MENKTEQPVFQYTYSAAQQKEIESIRQKYQPQQPDKLQQLRQLDAAVTQKATAAAMVCGVMGALVMGVGMCCVMVWPATWFVPGVFIGCAGIALVTAAWSTYRSISRKEREKIAPQILRLTDELLQK